MTTAVEANADGLIGPTHSYAGLSPGNLASSLNEGQASNPRAAVLQGLEKMKRLADLGLPPGFSPDRDRVMLCGSMAMIKETGELLESFGMKEGSNAEPGDYVLERAFVG